MPYLSMDALLNPLHGGPAVDSTPAVHSRRSMIAMLLDTADGPVLPTAIPLLPSVSFPPEVQHNVQITRKTTVSVLNIFNDISAHVDYPATNIDQPIGYLFRQDPSAWRNPMLDFAYSLGRPSGGTLPGEEVCCRVLVDKDDANIQVPCSKRHMTCMF